MDDRDPRGRETPEDYLGPLDGGRLLAFHGRTSEVPYVELHCHTCYSFREGASTPRELLAQAAALGYETLAVTDRDGLYGAMEFAKAAEEIGIRPIIGADVTLQGGYQLVLLAETREGYANLCQLLSGAHPIGRPGPAHARPHRALR
jgi:DNA polymerase III alpha subunit